MSNTAAKVITEWTIWETLPGVYTNIQHGTVMQRACEEPETPALLVT